MMENGIQLATALQLTVKALQFYTPDHPRVVEALVHLEQTCATLFAETPRVTLTMAKGTLLVEGEPITHPNAQVKTFAADLEKRRIGGLIFLSGVTRRELLEAVRVLAMRPEQLRAAGGPAEALTKADVMHVRISHVRYEAVTEGEEVVWSKSVRRVGPGETALVLPPSLQAMLDGETKDVSDLRTLLAAVANSDEQLTLLRERLLATGVSREQFDELLNAITWDRLPLDERLASLFEGNRMFELDAGKLQRFVRELLESDRAADVQRLLERYTTGLTVDAVAVRTEVCDALGQIITQTLPRECEQIVGTAILNHFVRVHDAQAAAAAANLLTVLIDSGRSERALRVIERLEETAPASKQELARAIGERAAVIVSQVCAADPDTLARFVMPLVAHLGATIAPHVIDALGHEEDRNRRGRLVKALKTIGEPAFPFLIDALRSPVWFVVRNALNVLGDVGTPELVESVGPTLGHDDPRVRRASARALSKIGGAEAERLLVASAHDRDAETQAEILLCLGAMKAQSAVPVLVEIMKPKGFFARDSPAVRVAAEKALAAIRT